MRRSWQSSKLYLASKVVPQMVRADARVLSDHRLSPQLWVSISRIRSIRRSPDGCAVFPSIELRHLRYSVAATEHRSFRKVDST